MEPGTELAAGKYRIVRPLGRGGMGAVYEALNTHTRKRVAIKCLLPSLALSNPDATERLAREAEASCRVRHPNVVDVYDVVHDGPSLFLVMEYLEGEPLTAAIDRGDLPLHRLISLLLAAMRAVAAAHAQGVVHRDIKPDNIFLARQADTAEPVPKVLDFGISKLEARGTGRISLTHAGAVLGTPIYMSYEQLLGAGDIDGRADVYAFGVVLYEALTGRPPYEASTYMEWLARFGEPPKPPSAHKPQIPQALDRLVMNCLARDRAERVPSMDMLIRELTPYATQHSCSGLMSMPSATTSLSMGRARSRTRPTPATLFEGEPSAQLRAAQAGAAAPPSVVLRPRRSLRIAAAVSCAALLLGLAAWFLGRPRNAHETQLQAAQQERALPPPPAAPAAPDPEPPAVVMPSHQQTGAAVTPPPPAAVELPRAQPRVQPPEPPPARPSTKPGSDWGIY